MKVIHTVMQTLIIFLQVDYGRDLGEVVSEAMEVVLLDVRKNLLAGNLNQTDMILCAWDKLLDSRNTSELFLC